MTEPSHARVGEALSGELDPLGGTHVVSPGTALAVWSLLSALGWGAILAMIVSIMKLV